MTERGEIHSGRIALDLNEKFGAGDGDRTRNFQLGNQNFRSFIFNTYKTAQEKYACMLRIPCIALPDLRVAAGRLRDGVSWSDGTEHSSGSSEWLVGMR